MAFYEVLAVVKGLVIALADADDSFVFDFSVIFHNYFIDTAVDAAAIDGADDAAAVDDAIDDAIDAADNCLSHEISYDKFLNIHKLEEIMSKTIYQVY